MRKKGKFYSLFLALNLFISVALFTGCDSTNNDLANIILSDGVLSPEFTKDTLAYTSSVPYSVSEISVTAVSEDISQSILINGTKTVSNFPVIVALSVAENPIEIIVTAEDGSTKTYNVTVAREGAPVGGGNISIYLELPAGWPTPWIWYDSDLTTPEWDTTVLMQPPGDMVEYRPGWYMKEINNTDAVSFLINDGTWNQSIRIGGGDYTTTEDVWITVDPTNGNGIAHSLDPMGITVYFEKPENWDMPYMWFDQHQDGVWETTVLGQAPGDMEVYREGWYKKEFAETNAVEFLFNNGTWDQTVRPQDGSNYNITETVWITQDGTVYTTDPVTIPEIPDRPTITVNNTGGYFTSPQTVTITIDSSIDLIENKYAFGNEVVTFNGNQITFTVGQDMFWNQGKFLRVYSRNESGAVVNTYYFKKGIEPEINKLGADYSACKTTFAIWSPDVADVTVTVDENEYSLAKLNEFDGYTDVYAVKVYGNLKLKEYQFKINGVVVMDPYGVMCKATEDINIVMNLNETNPDSGWVARPALIEREDAVIYEVHVRDFTLDENSGVSEEKRGRFMGMVQTGTTNASGLQTGIDHLKELGVTHVQIMPMYDYGSTLYNWGYDPRNFNIPEDQYASDANDYVNRIKEVKIMINEFHKNGIRVIMDVVYNHTYNQINVFENITSRYYDGLNLSGTGNSIDASDPMVSRFIRDSLEYWIKEYNVDGFRFDLAGILMTDEVRAWSLYLTEKYADRNILLYGEPWNGYATDPNQNLKVRAGKVPTLADAHYGIFSWNFREALKGANDDNRSGYLFNYQAPVHNAASIQAIEQGSRGSILNTLSKDPLANDWDPMFAYDPEQSINYVSAHDNYCLWDKILLTLDGNITRAVDQQINVDMQQAERINKFAIAILMTSQGIPFMHAGDELLRTKTIDYTDWTVAHNTFSSPDQYNTIQWDWKSNNIDNFNYYKSLVALRKNHPGFRMNTWQEITDNVTSTIVSNQVLVTQIDADKNGDSWDEIIVVYNSGSDYIYQLPAGDWQVAIEAENANSTTGTVSGEYVCEGTAVTIFYRE